MLIIDTSTERSIIAVIIEGAVVFSDPLPEGYQASRLLAAHLQTGLLHANIPMQEIDVIAVGTGPGSYTGLRVGAIFGKTLSYALKIPLVGVCSLKGFVPASLEGTFTAAIDARSGGIYCLSGHCADGEAFFESPPQLLSPEEAKLLFTTGRAVVTPHTALLQARLGVLPGVSWEERAPCPLTLAKQGQRAYEMGEVSLDGSLDLLYLRNTASPR